MIHVLKKKQTKIIKLQKTPEYYPSHIVNFC